MPAERISSLQNPRIKQLVKLRDRRPRDEAGVFLVEGYREIRRALEKKVALNEVYYAPEWFLGDNEPALLAQAAAAGAALSNYRRTPLQRSPTANGRTGCSPWRRNGERRWRILRRRSAEPFPSSWSSNRSRNPAIWARSCAGPTRPAASGHRVRPGDGPVQPECRPGLDRRAVFRSVRRRGEGGRPGLAAGEENPGDRDNAGGAAPAQRRRSDGPSPSSWAASNTA